MNKRRPSIPQKTRLKLWVKSGGRCQYLGCNIRLDIDEIKQTDINKSYIAHIYGFREKSARYDPVLSPKLAIAFSNLMLLCDTCHRRIDHEEKELHTASMLLEMKKKHEERINALTSIKEDVKTHIISYTSRIGNFEPNIDFDVIRNVIASKNLYPIGNPIELGSFNNPLEDNDNVYWLSAEKSLCANFEKLVTRHFRNGELNHFSLFALAPQPLLIRLGTLITDLYTVDVYQKHREPDSWAWREKGDFIDFIIDEPLQKNGLPCLAISLSASIENDRIYEVMPNQELSIWKIRIENPNNNFLAHPEILSGFRTKMRILFNRIKLAHGHNTTLKVFPCMPNSAAVELGRIWMPKADMSLEIYDERNGFKKALSIKRT